MKFRTKLLVWFLQIIIVVLSFVIYACLKLDDLFDESILALWSSGQLVIVSFRVLIYFFPAIIVWIIWKLFCKKTKLPLVESFKYQFILFTFFKALWVFSGMDYITSVGLFDVMDSFIIVAGLLLTLILRKKSSVEPDLLDAITENATLSYDSKKWLFQCDDENEHRYCLGRPGKNNLIVFGINPNTGIPNLPEDTVKRVIAISRGLGYDGWVMLNIYPERQPIVESLPDTININHNSKNLEVIESIIKKYPNSPIVAAWGNDIVKKPYLKKCAISINEIMKKNGRTWKCFKINKTGDPKHSLYLSSDTKQLIDFDFEKRYPPIQ